MNTLLTIELLIVVIGFLLALIPSIESLKDRSLNGWKRNLMLYLTLLLFTVLLFTTFYKFKASESAAKQRDFFIDSTRRASDTAILKGIESGRARLFLDLSDALGKQKLVLDTARKEFKVLQDSVLVTTKKSNRPYPILSLCSIKILESTQETLRLQYKICSDEAPSKVQELKAYIIFNTGANTWKYMGDRLTDLILPRNTLIPTDQPLFPKATYPDIKPVQVFVKIKGSYSDLDETKITPISYWYVFTPSTNKFSRVSAGYINSLERELNRLRSNN